MRIVPQRVKFPLTAQSSKARENQVNAWESNLKEFSKLLEEVTASSHACASSPAAWQQGWSRAAPTEKIEVPGFRKTICDLSSEANVAGQTVRSNCIQAEETLYVKCQKTKLEHERTKLLQMADKQFFKPGKLQGVKEGRAQSAPVRASSLEKREVEGSGNTMESGMFEQFKRQQLEAATAGGNVFDNSHLFRQARSQSVNVREREAETVNEKDMINAKRQSIALSKEEQRGAFTELQSEAMDLESDETNLANQMSAAAHEYACAKNSLQQYLLSRTSRKRD